jgi:hypothetical protein
MNLLQQGLAGGRPIKAVLADARSGKAVSANEWRTLAFYSWDTDEAQLVPAAERAALLGRLAAACPAAEADSATRLLLKALAATEPGQPVPGGAATEPRVRQLLADAAASRRQMDVLVNYAPDIVRALAPKAGPAQTALVQATDAALARLQGDATLSRGDQFSALAARVDLARLDQPEDSLHPKLPKPLVQEVKALAGRMDREITDGFERQAVITGAAHTLASAGLWQDSNALLESNLAKSHSPYYLMSQLGGNARRLGDKPPRCAGTVRPGTRAWARPPACSGAPTTSAPWWSWRRTRRHREGRRQGAGRGDRPGRRLLRAQRAFAAEGGQPAGQVGQAGPPPGGDRPPAGPAGAGVRQAARGRWPEGHLRRPVQGLMDA